MITFFLLNFVILCFRCQIKALKLQHGANNNNNNNNNTILYKEPLSDADTMLGRQYYLYVGLLGSTLLVAYLKAWCLSVIATTVSRNIHQKVFTSLLAAQVKVYQIYKFCKSLLIVIMTILNFGFFYHKEVHGFFLISLNIIKEDIFIFVYLISIHFWFS